MKVTRTRTLRFNTGAYEHLETSATVEFDTNEPQGDPAVADDILNALLQPDVERADKTSRTPERETFVHAWKDSI